MSKLSELKMNRVDGLHVRNSYSDYDHWVNWDDVKEILREPELNDNQLTVLEWLKSEKEWRTLLETISKLAFLECTGGKMKWPTASEAWLILSETEKYEVLQAFAEWGLSNDKD